MPPKTRRINFLFTDEARELLHDLAEDRGISMTAALEVIIREEAKRRGIANKSAPKQGMAAERRTLVELLGPHAKVKRTPGRPAAVKQAEAGEAGEKR